MNAESVKAARAAHPDRAGEFADAGRRRFAIAKGCIRRRSGTSGSRSIAITPARRRMPAFGQPVDTQYNFEKARVILSLDGDFLSSGFPGFHRNARQFAARRNPELKEEMLRFYAVESTPTNTGAQGGSSLAGARLARSRQFARALAAQVGVAGAGGQAQAREQQKFVAAVAKDLQAHGARAVVVAGRPPAAAVHALAHAINRRWAAWADGSLHGSDRGESGRSDRIAEELVGEMNAGKVDLLLIVGGAIRCTTRPPTGFRRRRWTRFRLRVHHGLYSDETAQPVSLARNGTHYLEQWGDARAFDGTSASFSR